MIVSCNQIFYLELDIGAIFERCSGSGASKGQEGLTLNEALEVKCLDYLEAFFGLNDEIIKREFKNIDKDGDGRVTLKESQNAFKYLRADSQDYCWYVCPDMYKVKLVNKQSECPEYVETNISNPPYTRECNYLSEAVWLFKFCIYQGCFDKFDPEWDVCPNDYPYHELLTDNDGLCTQI